MEISMNIIDNNANKRTNSNLKEDIFRKIFEQQAQHAPSESFASGTVFDLSKQNREMFLDVLHSKNAMALQQLFVNEYALFLGHPERVGFNSQMVNKCITDTNPFEWNADIVELADEMYAALLYMPVQNSDISARIVGIIFTDYGDGYYYCMLHSDAENVSSKVYRNNGRFGVHKIGEVKGLGFELMNSFLDCIRDDFYTL